jgi:hypothetical protein
MIKLVFAHTHVYINIFKLIYFDFDFDIDIPHSKTLFVSVNTYFGPDLLANTLVGTQKNNSCLHKNVR